MSPLARTIIKNTLTSAAVGVLIAVALPAVIVGVGALFHAGLTTAVVTSKLGLLSSPLWEGIFFGGFGGIAAAVAPISDYLFGKPAEQNSVAQAELEGTDVSYSRARQQGMFPDFSDMERTAPKVPHTEQLDTSRSMSPDAVSQR